MVDITIFVVPFGNLIIMILCAGGIFVHRYKEIIMIQSPILAIYQPKYWLSNILFSEDSSSPNGEAPSDLTGEAP
jgi:hypothetical protein